MVRLAFYTENYLVGGAERYLTDLILGLDARRYDIVLITNSNPRFKCYLHNRQLEKLPHRAIPIIGPPPPLLRMVRRNPQPNTGDTSKTGERRPNYVKAILMGMWRYAAIVPNLISLTAAFRAQAIDILHINNGGYPAAESCRWAPMAARLAGIPVCLMTVHSIAEPVAWPAPIERKIDQRVDAHLDALIGMSAAIASSMLNNRAFSSNKVHPFDLGTDVARPDEATVLGWRAQLGVPRDAVVVGQVGEFVSRKGQQVLVEAFQRVVQEAWPRPVYLVFVGEGELRPNIEEQVRRMGLGQCVIFTGYRADASRWISALDILVAPSTLPEGQGYVNLEAAAQAKPVIASRVGGFPEVVTDEDTGLLIPPGDSQALAGALRRLITDEALRLSMGEAGRRRYETKFTLDRLLARTHDLYTELLAR